MTISNRSPQLRLARLKGEEMLKFRHGRNLYSYCVECQHGKYTESKVLGCEIGDNPDVVDFSMRYTQDPALVDTEKCPGFEPRQEVGVIANVPGDAQNNDAEDLFGMMEGGKLEDLKDKREQRQATARILQIWKGGFLSEAARHTDRVDNIYEGYLSWRKNAAKNR